MKLRQPRRNRLQELNQFLNLLKKKKNNCSFTDFALLILGSNHLEEKKLAEGLVLDETVILHR